MRRTIARRGNSTMAIIIVIVVVIVIAILSCVGFMLLSAITLPALATARETARALREEAMVTQSETQLHAFDTARAASTEHFPDVTPTLDALIANGQLTVEYTQSPFGPAPDGGADYWFDPHRPQFAEAEDASRYVVGYDRAMYASHESVAVLFANAEVRILTIEELDALLAAEPNAGRDFTLPVRRQ